MYRVMLEDLLGVQVHGGRLRVQPCLPPDWPEFELTWRRGETTLRIHVINERSGEAFAMMLDGTAQDGNEIDLPDDGREHELVVRRLAQPDAPQAALSASVSFNQ